MFAPGAWLGGLCLLLAGVPMCLAERGDIDAVVDPRGQPLRQRRHGRAEAHAGGEGRSSLQLQSTSGDPCSPGGPAWEAMAGLSSCGARIARLVAHEQMQRDTARTKVATDFPRECGRCSEAAGPGSIPRQQWRQPPALVQRRGSRRGADEPKKGIGFHLKSMVNPMDQQEAVKKIADLGVQSVRMWDYDASTLQDLLDGGIKDALVDVPQAEVAGLAQDAGNAQQVIDAIKPAVEGGMTIRVGIGNEPLHAGDDGKDLKPALENMVSALKSAGLDSVTVTVPFAAGILSGENNTVVGEVAKVINDNGGEFTIHLYPWFEHKNYLDNAIGKDGDSSMLFGQAKKMREILTEIDGALADMPLTIGESGWPSEGEEDATEENTCAYAKFFVESADSLDSNLRTAYLFEAFDEGMKASGGDGAKSKVENHFGIMKEDGSLKSGCDGLSFS